MANPKITSNEPNAELWRQTAKALDNGDFSLLDDLLRENKTSIIELLEANGEPKECMEEAFAWACFTGRTPDVETLLNKGVDPSSVKSGQTGFHYAAMGGHIDLIKLLIEKRVPMEVKNMYGGSVLGQALYSAVFEHRDSHAAIIELLIGAGAAIEQGTLEWWEDQDVLSDETKQHVASVLCRTENR